MAKKITIRDVAEEAKVSVASVSRVLNGNPKVDREIAGRVKEVIARLNYIPNENARRIKNCGSRKVCAILPSLDENFFSKVAEGMTEECDRKGLELVLYSCHGDVQNEKENLLKVHSSGACGLLYCPGSKVDTELIKSTFAPDFPLIMVYRRNILENTPHIYHDNISGGYVATRYFLKQGRKNIVFIAGLWGNLLSTSDEILDFMKDPQRGAYSSLDRLEGHIRALNEEGIEFDKNYLIGSEYTFSGGYNAIKKILSRLVDFDAVICGNDSVAAGVETALSEQNISVPGQVSIIGYDDSIFSTIARPTITSVRQQPRLIGSQAVDMLTQRMNGLEVADRKIDVELIVRNSTSVKE